MLVVCFTKQLPAIFSDEDILLNDDRLTICTQPPPPADGVNLRAPSQSISNHHSDIRLRNLYGIWVAPPAIAMMAYANLEGLTTFDAVQRLLFCESSQSMHARFWTCFV